MAVRAIIGGTVTDYLPGSEYTWKVFVLHADAGIRLVVFQQYVVARLVFLDKIVFFPTYIIVPSVFRYW